MKSVPISQIEALLTSLAEWLWKEIKAIHKKT